MQDSKIKIHNVGGANTLPIFLFETRTKHGIPYKITTMHFDSREDEIIFICKNQAGRRNLTPEQLSYLRGQEYEAEKVKKARNPAGNNQYSEVCDRSGHNPLGERGTRKLVAERHHVGEGTIQRDSEFSRAVDTIGNTAPELRQKILSGEIAAPKKQIVEIAEKPEPERKAKTVAVCKDLRWRLY